MYVQINWEEQLGSKTNHTTQGSSVGKASKLLAVKNLGGSGLWWQEKLPASQESSLERPPGSWNVPKPTNWAINTRRAQLGSGGSD